MKSSCACAKDPEEILLLLLLLVIRTNSFQYRRRNLNTTDNKQCSRTTYDHIIEL